MGYIAMNFYVLYTGDHDASGSEQELIYSWIGDPASLWLLLAGFSILRVILSVTLCRALWNFWKAFGLP